VFNINTGVTEADRDKLYDVNGNFVASDVGRMIRMEKTPPFSGFPQDKHLHEEYRIIEVIDGNTIRLEHARFEDEIDHADPDLQIHYRIYASITFNSDSANFPELHADGGPVVNQFISIVDPVNPSLAWVPWMITYWENSTTLTISDWTGTLVDIAQGTNLKWYLHDKRVYTYWEMFSVVSRFLFDCGWTLTQDRGRHADPAFWGGIATSWQGRLRDKVFHTTGEDGDRSAFLRMIFTNSDATTLQNGNGIGFGMWNMWDPNFDNGANNSNGMGTAVTYSRGTHHASQQDLYPNASSSTSYPPVWSATNLSQGSALFWQADMSLPNNLGIPGGQLQSIDYFLYGDKDEVHLYFFNPTRGFAYQSFGFVKEVSQNRHIFRLQADVAAGAGVVLNVGDTQDPQAAGYKVGDNIQIAGQHVATGRGGLDRTESATITTFGASGADYTITVSLLNRAYKANALIGEEPQGVFTSDFTQPSTFGGSGSVWFLNAAKHNDTTHHDWNGTMGFTGVISRTPSVDFNEIQPNQRGGRFGILGIALRNVVGREFRGRMRYLHSPSHILTAFSFIKDQNDQYYWSFPRRFAGTTAENLFAIGPISKEQVKL
jgi:hypothetical protein